MPENRPAWELWKYVCGQWRTSGMGGLLALDYGAVFEIARGLNIPMHQGNLERIRALENSVLEIQKTKGKT